MLTRSRISEAARARIAETLAQRDRVRRASLRGCPLDAEPIESRKIDRIRAVTGVDEPVARALARYEDPARVGLTGDRRLGAERIQGRSTDFVGVAFVEEARTTANAVARVAFTDGRPQGSGFLVSGRLFLTNNHVIGSADEARQFVLEFDYELDPAGLARPVTRFELDPDTFFLTDDQDDLDFTVIAVGRRVQGARELESLGSCPLLARTDKHVLGEFVNVIQHPEGDFKQVVLRENQLVARLDTVLHYAADTLPGASGSPVFNDQWEAVALHHWGEPHRQVVDASGRPLDTAVNEGIRISAIARALEARAADLAAPARALLEQALASTGTSRPMPLPSPPNPSPEAPIPNPFVLPEVPTMSQVRIPIEIVINVGSAGVTATAPSTNGHATPEAAEKVSIDTNYGNRNGYNPSFLTGHPVPLPKLGAAELAHAARVHGASHAANPNELKYQHFSIVVNGDRKLAFFTAVNINGATYIPVDRDTGEPESMEATETWYRDPRIDEDAQSDQSVYSKQRPSRVFDRGHLVRRADPCWGTRNRARRANADTFHFTNCTPQHEDFNQNKTTWAGLEDYILLNANKENFRASVFTGPVFAADDDEYRDVQLPRQFWKVAVIVKPGDALSATAYLLSQAELIEGLEADEEFSYGAYRTFQVPVARIQDLTGLTFGELVRADPLDGEEAAVLREIAGPEDLRL